jgi:hypothetical protein
MVEKASPCRLFVILARRASVAAVLRRGPSKWVQLSAWDTSTDAIEHGQWFHGRIYERRCDLSPDGSLFLYFAQKITAPTLADKEYTYAWTAIGKLPYFSALALWPKGDCWHGGGLFTSTREVWLNHRPEVALPHPAHKPKGLRVTPNPDAHGEDEPVYEKRRLRDGWVKVQEGSFQPRSRRGGWMADRPEVWVKLNRAKTHQLVERLEGIDYERFGGARVLSFSIQAASGGDERPLDRVEWADWDHGDRLLFARKGVLCAAQLDDKNIDIRTVADLNGERPTDQPPPAWALRW